MMYRKSTHTFYVQRCSVENRVVYGIRQKIIVTARQATNENVIGCTVFSKKATIHKSTQNI
jgi:hypothetical protein